MKQCNICGEWKVLDDFYERSGQARHYGDGHHGHCKACHKARTRELHQDYRETGSNAPYLERQRQAKKEWTHKYRDVYNQRRRKART
jgi:hypothetical protein